MIKRPKGSHSTSTPLEEPPKIIDIKEDAKPVVIPEQISQENQAANGVLCVPLQQLTLQPVQNKQPTARRGKPFKSSGITR